MPWIYRPVARSFSHEQLSHVLRQVADWLDEREDRQLNVNVVHVSSDGDPDDPEWHIEVFSGE